MEPPETFDILRLADDGCPHVEAETVFGKLIGPPLFAPYAVFVPFSPPVLRAMIGKEYDVMIDRATYSGRSGSIVASMCEADIDAIYNRFYPPRGDYGEDETGDSGCHQRELGGES